LGSEFTCLASTYEQDKSHFTWATPAPPTSPAARFRRPTCPSRCLFTTATTDQPVYSCQIPPGCLCFSPGSPENTNLSHSSQNSYRPAACRSTLLASAAFCWMTAL